MSFKAGSSPAAVVELDRSMDPIHQAQSQWRTVAIAFAGGLLLAALLLPLVLREPRVRTAADGEFFTDEAPETKRIDKLERQKAEQRAAEAQEEAKRALAQIQQFGLGHGGFVLFDSGRISSIP